MDSSELSAGTHPEYRRSMNERLERIFARTPEFVNREWTLPCHVDPTPIFEDPLVRHDPRLAAVIRDHLRAIVPVGDPTALPMEVQPMLHLLASPFECGRVLEVDEPYPIDGLPHTLTVKGVGTTAPFRDGRINRLWPPLSAYENSIERKQREIRKSQFRHFAYTSLQGELERLEATNEHDRARELGSFVRVERVLAAFQILGIPDDAGRMRPMRELKEQWFFASWQEPTLLVRATRTNFRMLDILTLAQLGWQESIAPLLEHGRTVVEHERVVSTVSEYWQWLTRTVTEQRIACAIRGYVERELSPKSPTERWRTLARNVSLAGEEIDVGSLHRAPEVLRDLQRFRDHMRNAFVDCETALRELTNTVATFGSERLDDVSIADACADGVAAAIQSAGGMRVPMTAGASSTVSLDTLRTFLLEDFDACLGNVVGLGERTHAIAAYVARMRARLQAYRREGEE